MSEKLEITKIKVLGHLCRYGREDLLNRKNKAFYNAFMNCSIEDMIYIKRGVYIHKRYYDLIQIKGAGRMPVPLIKEYFGVRSYREQVSGIRHRIELNIQDYWLLKDVYVYCELKNAYLEDFLSFTLENYNPEDDSIDAKKCWKEVYSYCRKQNSFKYVKNSNQFWSKFLDQFAGEIDCVKSDYEWYYGS